MLASIAKSPKTQRSQSVSVAAPIGGWNARDALGAMGKLDAVTLTNMWPGTSSVVVRDGNTHFATGLVNEVESLMAYAGGSTAKLFGAAGASIFNVTAGGAVGAAAGGLTTKRTIYLGRPIWRQ
jgi:hypothetical protein